MGMRPQKPSHSAWLVPVVALLSMVGPFSIDTYLPSFKAIEFTFSVSRELLSQSLGFYLMAFAVSTLFWGPLADRFGRRRVVLWSLSLYLLASLACAMTTSFSQLLLARTIQGLGAGGGLVAGRAMIRDSFESRLAHRAMSQVMILFAVAPAIAPIIGGVLESGLGWRSVFYFLALYAVLTMVMVYTVIPETLPSSDRQSLQLSTLLAGYRQLLRHWQFMALILALSIAFSGLFLYIAGAPTILFDFLGLGSGDFGFQFVPMVAGLMFGAYVTGRLTHRWSSQKIVHVAFGVLAVACVLNLLQVLWLPAYLLTVIGPLVVYAVGIAMALPGLSILALDCFPRRRGMASALQSFLQMSSSALVASLVVPFLKDSLGRFVFGQIAFTVLAALLWWVAFRKMRPIS
ncbi:MAG TPA: Bcr/CflA family efflux MFS transporter [Gammaproteobacteria bacterium]|nr:Bcr/CflA family efflux MFS transporter [Gammaproteobacteria bacterium]